jgi:hypothetical protein
MSIRGKIESFMGGDSNAGSGDPDFDALGLGIIDEGMLGGYSPDRRAAHEEMPPNSFAMAPTPSGVDRIIIKGPDNRIHGTFGPRAGGEVKDKLVELGYTEITEPNVIERLKSSGSEAGG